MPRIEKYLHESRLQTHLMVALASNESKEGRDYLELVVSTPNEIGCEVGSTHDIDDTC